MADEHKENEGEGSRAAAEAYNESQKQFVKKEDVDARAQEAKAALEGEEAEALRQAEEVGKSKLREEDPQVHRDR